MKDTDPHITRITETAPVATNTHGGRAKCLQRLVRLSLPVPLTVALSFRAVNDIAEGRLPSMADLLEPFGEHPLLCVRPSSEDPDWGGPSAVLNIGMNDATHARLSEKIGEEAATALYKSFVRTYSVHVERLDPDMFEDLPPPAPRRWPCPCAPTARKPKRNFPRTRPCNWPRC